MTGVLVLGALHLDVVVDAPRLPRIDETLAGTAVAYRFGGKGGNQAVAAARCGASVAMVGRVGTDDFARIVLAELDAAGVDRSGVAAMEGATGMSVAIVDGTGSYGAVTVGGVNLGVDGHEASLSLPPCICLMQNEIPEAANVALADRLPTETRLVVNAAPARHLPREISDRMDLLIVNRLEAGDLLGGVASERNPAEMAGRLFARYGADVIVTLGPDGCVLVTKDGATALPAKQVDVVSTHGAGDAFCGCLATRLAEGVALRGAIEAAQEYAARIVATPRDLRHASGL